MEHLWAGCDESDSNEKEKCLCEREDKKNEEMHLCSHISAWQAKTEGLFLSPLIFTCWRLIGEVLLRTNYTPMDNTKVINEEKDTADIKSAGTVK